MCPPIVVECNRWVRDNRDRDGDLRARSRTAWTVARKRSVPSITLLSLSVGVLLTVACGPQVYLRDHAERELRRRAAFETDCPADELTLTPLSSEMATEAAVNPLTGSGTRETDTPRTMGVSGCGKRGTYVYVAGKGYVLDSSSDRVRAE